MKFLNNIKKALADESGLSLIELIVAAALITIVGAGFCSAAAGASVSTVNNEKSVKERNVIVSYIDQEALKPIVTSAESLAHYNSYGWELNTNEGDSVAELQGSIDANANYTDWAEIKLVDSGGTVIAGTTVDCAVCKPIDGSYTTDDEGNPVDRIYFGFQCPNDATTS